MKRPVALLPALVSLALLGSSLAGCAKHDHHLPHTEPSGAPCGGTQPSPEPTTSASSSSISSALNNSRRTASATPLPSSSQPPLSYVALNSNPSGLCAQIANGAGSYSKIGNTPLKNTPPFNQQPYTYEIVPNNGNPNYAFTYDQTTNGANVDLLYNQNADTSGVMIVSAESGTASKAKKLARSAIAFSRMLHLAPSKSENRPAFSSTELAVRYRVDVLQKTGAMALDVERAEHAGAARSIGFVRNGLATRIVKVQPGDTTVALAGRLKKHASVYDARPLGLRYHKSSIPKEPNDTLFENVDQWDYFRIQMPNAWGYTIGSSAITIGIIDTGADDTNPDLSPNLIYGESDIGGVNTPGFGVGGSEDEDGHGTNVSGIASAATNNGEGVAGIAWNTPIAIYRIFPDPTNSDNSPGASTADEAQAIYNAVGNQGVKVINLSLGSAENGGWDPVEHDAVEYAINAGVTVVAAAGNERTTTLNPGVDFPGAYEGVIAVGATSLNDGSNPCANESSNFAQCSLAESEASEYVSSYSNTGPQLAIVAPGGDPSTDQDPDPLHWITGLYSNEAFNAETGCSQGTVCLAQYAGTSQATPHVTGTVALMLLEAKAKGIALTPASIKRILQSTADNISDPNQGSGRLNAYRALASVAGDTSLPQNPANPLNFVAFAYDNGAANGQNGQTVPHIIDVTYPQGVPVDQYGNFRIADIMGTAHKYTIAVWADVNGDGKIDAGDYFGSAQGTCEPTSPCTAAQQIVASPVGSGFQLP